MVRLNIITHYITTSHYTTQIHTVHLILGQIHRLYMSIHIFIIYPLSLFGMCIASLWSTGWFISFQNWELKSQRVWPWPIRSSNIFTAQNRGVATNNQIHSSNQIWQWQTIGFIYIYIHDMFNMVLDFPVHNWHYLSRYFHPCYVEYIKGYPGWNMSLETMVLLSPHIVASCKLFPQNQPNDATFFLISLGSPQM